MLRNLSPYLRCIQKNLFPFLEEHYGLLTPEQEKLTKILELVRIEEHLGYRGCYLVGRPLSDRSALARSFVAKIVCNISQTEDLIERLKNDKTLRHLCGFSTRKSVPSRSTFSRAFEEFAISSLATRAHQALIDFIYESKLTLHISRDATAIEAREKPVKKNKNIVVKKPSKRGRPKKGEVAEAKLPSRLDKQMTMSLSEMIGDLPKPCDVGTKRNSKGYKVSWSGYKFHIDVADGDIPISAILTSASVHDSQVSIPLSLMTEARINYCYELMDAAYDAPQIKAHSKRKGRVAIIDGNPRRNKELKEEMKQEAARQKLLGITLPEKIRYNQRSSAERVNARIKDEFAGRIIYYKGHDKIYAHLMLSLLVIAADQAFRLIY